MKVSRLAVAFFAATCCAWPAWAAPSTVHTEVEGLLTRLQDSGCRFNRNGSWYNGKKAKEHLSDKLDYIERKGSLKSTEQFIDLAGSSSSMSGKPYQVQCGNGPAVESRTWLLKELGAMRASGGRPAP